ncbi:MAG: hypothetical protein Q9217_001040 [Psora testacea]
MKTTLALHWKTFVNKLHPPLPLTPRDSQSLLNFLNSSFRRQLEQRHPKKEDHNANDHVQSILTSPLFLGEPVRPPKTFEHKPHQTPNTPSWIRQLDQEPMTVLQDRIAAGAADLNIARLCLHAQMRRCSTDPNVKASMRSSDAGSIVLHWLWSSGLEMSLNFLNDQSITRLLIGFLVAEDRHDRIYSWIRQEKQLQNMLVYDDFRKIQSRIIFQLIKAETMYGAGSASAVKIFIQKLDEFVNAKKKLKDIRSRLSTAGNYMIMSLPQMLQRGDISMDDYDAIFDSTRIWCKQNTLEIAWLAVHHPEKPCPDLALTYLHHLGPRDLAGMLRGRRNNTATIALKTAEQLLAQGRRAEVAWIMKALRRHFAAEIGFEHFVKELPPTGQSNKHVEEISNVQLLESLGLESDGFSAADILTRGPHAIGVVGD